MAVQAIYWNSLFYKTVNSYYFPSRLSLCAPSWQLSVVLAQLTVWLTALLAVYTHKRWHVLMHLFEVLNAYIDVCALISRGTLWACSPALAGVVVCCVCLSYWVLPPPQTTLRLASLQPFCLTAIWLNDWDSQLNTRIGKTVFVCMSVCSISSGSHVSLPLVRPFKGPSQPRTKNQKKHYHAIYCRF